MKLYALLLLQEAAAADGGFTNELVRRFNEGGQLWMTPILICLIIGLAIAFERIISLNRSDINTRKFMNRVKEALESGGISAAEEVCANTRGPAASVVQAGLLRYDEGMDAVEKAVVSYGSIEMSFLERGLVWLSLFISIAPMLGFLGTVIGMVQAFDAIEAAGDISPSLVAGGIKVALLTTVFGLIVAMILQVFYNYCVSKIDRITADMEEASVELIDALAMMNMGRPVRAVGAGARTASLPSASSEVGRGDDLTKTDLS
ncbi:MAG TPA: MotA/TolQ/ExbB proton channel family protein [Rubricoccaceae bacterium]|nr:MotA/TolQ/ExbB proton channel family protein [Rubricoccaceae bacterium]